MVLVLGCVWSFGGGRVVLQWDGWGGSVVGVVWIGVGLCWFVCCTGFLGMGERGMVGIMGGIGPLPVGSGLLFRNGGVRGGSLVLVVVWHWPTPCRQWVADWVGVGLCCNGVVGWWGGACGRNSVAAVVVDCRCRKATLP